MIFKNKQNCKDPAIEFWNLFKNPPDYSIPDFLMEKFPGKEISYCAKARTGINEIIKSLGIGEGDHILAPAFNCGSEIDPFLAHKADLKLFPVGIDTIIDPSEIASRIQENTK
ncbi:MAG: hypothetical protein V7701_15985, partial [Sneathiella sp.]